MRFDTLVQNFWLPLVAGVVMALPAFFPAGEPAGTVLAPSPAGAPRVELRCGPFVESFAAMRAEAERIAGLASSAAAPEEESAVSLEAAETWREIAASARSLDAWMWDAHAQSAPLNLREASVVSIMAPVTSDIRADATAVAGQLSAPPAELDSALLFGRMQAVEHGAQTVARSLEPLAACEPLRELSYAPAEADCETLDPEYQFAMAGPCGY